MEELNRDKVDIKVLILYIISRLPAPIDRDRLFELCLSDEGVGYFDYTECLYELIYSGHIDETDDGLSVTAKGRKNAAALEKTLLYSVRKAADRSLKPVADELSRFSNITADVTGSGSDCGVHLALSDGKGVILDMQMLCGSEEQAKTVRRNFRKNAEKYYIRFIEMLSEDSGKKKK